MTHLHIRLHIRVHVLAYPSHVSQSVSRGLCGYTTVLHTCTIACMCAHALAGVCMPVGYLLEATLHAHRSCTPSVRYVSVADHPVCVPAPPGETEGESQSCGVWRYNCGGAK